MIRGQLRFSVLPGPLLVAGIVAAIALGASPRGAGAHEGHAALPSKGHSVEGNQLLLSDGARQAIDLTTAKVTLAKLARTVECNARVEIPWSQHAMVTTQVPGRIAEILVRPGDEVAAGQVLARMESLELEALQLAMLQAEAELSLARDEYRRRSSLASDGVIAGRQSLDAETTLKQKTADLQIALCKLRAIGLEQQVLDEIRDSRRPLAHISIVSPMAGTVAETDTYVGQQVKTTEHLFHIVDRSVVWVIGSVLEGDSAQVNAGQRARVTFTSAPVPTISGTIDHRRLKIDEQRRTLAVVMKLSNPGGMLRPGMFGRMAIEVGESPDAVACPSEAVISDAGNHYVLLKRGESKYVRQPIRPGIRDRGRTEILDGLFPGDQVVTTGNHLLISLFGDAPESSSNPSVAEETNVPPPQTHDAPTAAIVAPGVVELSTDHKVFVGSRVEGRIRRILVEHSQPVQAGQVLAEVESLELRNLQGELLETEARLRSTSQRTDLLTPLAQQNLTSRNELRQLQTDVRVLSAKRDSLLRTLSMIGVPSEEVDRLLEVDLSSDDCNLAFVRSIPIRAPIDGVVADFDVLPGQVVSSESTLFEIHDTTRASVRGHLFQQDAVRVQIGQRVSLWFAAYPGDRVEGQVARLSPVLNAAERVLPLWVELDNADGRWIEGMWARMEIDDSPATPSRSPNAND